jgi:hypothetical protein
MIGRFAAARAIISSAVTFGRTAVRYPHPNPSHKRALKGVRNGADRGEFMPFLHPFRGEVSRAKPETERGKLALTSICDSPALVGRVRGGGGG